MTKLYHTYMSRVLHICWDFLNEDEYYLTNNHPVDYSFWKTGFCLLLSLKALIASSTTCLIIYCRMLPRSQLFWSLLSKTYNYRMFKSISSGVQGYAFFLKEHAVFVCYMINLGMTPWDKASCNSYNQIYFMWNSQISHSSAVCDVEYVN